MRVQELCVGGGLREGQNLQGKVGRAWEMRFASVPRSPGAMRAGPHILYWLGHNRRSGEVFSPGFWPLQLWWVSQVGRRV